jgi:hypothetical protein
MFDKVKFDRRNSKPVFLKTVVESFVKAGISESIYTINRKERATEMISTGVRIESGSL